MSSNVHITMTADEFHLDAAAIADLLDVDAKDVPKLMRDGLVTSLVERGEAEDEGRFRLTFFHGSRRARLTLDSSGTILHRSVVDFGELPVPRSARGPAR